MRNLFLTLTAATLAIPASMALPTSQADARRVHHYRGQPARHYRSCRHSDGTAGLIAGGAGGALVGNSILGHGALGTIAGGVGGAFAGRAIDRTITAKQRCN